MSSSGSSGNDLQIIFLSFISISMGSILNVLFSFIMYDLLYILNCFYSMIKFSESVRGYSR